jgi:MFS family permease
VVVASLAIASDLMLYGAVAPLLPRYVAAFDLSKTQAGSIVGAYSIGILVVAIPFGFAAARMGAQAVLVMGLLLLAASSLIFGVAGSFGVLVAARALQGAGAAAAWAGALTWVGKVAPSASRGEYIGMTVGAGVAGEIGGPALGAVASVTSPGAAFGVFAGLVALIALAAWRHSGVRIVDEVTSREVMAWANRPAVRLALGLALAPAVAVGVFDVLIPLELRGRHFGAAAIGGIFMAGALTTALASPAIGRWSDRSGRRAPTAAMFAATAAGASAIALPLSTAIYLACAFALLVAVGSTLTPTLAIVSDATSQDEQTSDAIVWGIANFVFAAALLVGSVGGASVAQAGGDDLALALMAGAFAIVVCGLFARGVNLGPGPEPRAAVHDDSSRP